MLPRCLLHSCCVFLCGRCGLLGDTAGPRGGEGLQRGGAAERGEEHPEKRRQPADGSAAAAAQPDPRGQKAKVSRGPTWKVDAFLFLNVKKSHAVPSNCSIYRMSLFHNYLPGVLNRAESSKVLFYCGSLHFCTLHVETENTRVKHQSQWWINMFPFLWITARRCLF